MATGGATTTASITLDLRVTGNKEWDSVADAIERIKNAAASVGKAQPVQVIDPAMAKRLGDLEKAYAKLSKENEGLSTKLTRTQTQLDNTKKKLAALVTSQKAASDTSKKLADDTKKVGDAVDENVHSFDPLIEAQKELEAEEKRNAQRLKDQAQLFKAVKDKSDEYARSVLATAQAIGKETKKQQEEAAALQKTTTEVSELIVSLSSLNPQFLQSNRGRGAQALTAELKTLIGQGKALPIAQLNQLRVAVDNVRKAELQWAKDMTTLSGRLTFFEQQMDAILRASYRFKAVGADLTRFANNIANGFKNVMNTFSDFDFNLRRAAGSIGFFDNAVQDGWLGTGEAGIQSRLSLLSSSALDVARNIKMIPVADIAKGFYFWGSMTGVVVNSMDDLNELVRGHTSVLQAATMTEVGFETALKGVYSVLTQFYHGDLSKTTEVTEKLFYVTQKTAAEFGDLINSFKMVGPVAASLGVKFEDVADVLGQLADLGMRGTMAGRAIRQIFIQLVRPSVMAKKALEGAFSGFLLDFSTLDDKVQTSLKDIASYGSYYEAVFPQGKYAGIEQQIRTLAAITMNMTDAQRKQLLGVMSTANSVPVLMALVGRKIREIQLGVTLDSKINMRTFTQDAKAYFEANWRALSESWRGVVGGVQRTLESLKVTVGAAIAEWAKPILNWISQIVDKVREWAEANPKLVATLSKFTAFVGILAGIGGAIVSLTGILLGLGAVTHIFIGAFTQAAKYKKILGDVATAAGMAKEEVERLAASAMKTGANFGAMARSGLAAFTGILGLVIIVLETLQRNADYIRVRFEEIVRMFSSSGGLKGALSTVFELIISIQQGIQQVFDLLIRRVVDAVVVFAQLIDGIGKFVSWIKEMVGQLVGVQNLTGAFDLLGKAIGTVFAIVMLQQLYQWIKTLAIMKGAVYAVQTGVIAFQIAMFDAKKAAMGLATIPGILGAIKAGFIGAAGAARGFMAATGVGLAVVGLSLLVEWIGNANSSIDDLRQKSEALKAEFGEAGDAAEMMARSIAASFVKAREAASVAEATPWAEQVLGEQLAPQGLTGEQYQQWLAVDNARRQEFLDGLRMSNEDFVASVTEEANRLMERWKVAVASKNAELAHGGSDYQIDLGYFLGTLIRLDRTGLRQDLDQSGVIDDLDQQMREQLAIMLASIDPTLSKEELTAIYGQWTQRGGGAYLGISLADFIKLLFDEAGHEAKVLLAQQNAWSAAIDEAISGMNLGPDSAVSAWSELLEKTVTVGGYTRTISDLIAHNLVNEQTLKAITDGAFQATDDLVEQIESVDFTSGQIKILGQAFQSLLTRYVSQAYAGAIEGWRLIVDQLNQATIAGNTPSLSELYAIIFNTQIANFDPGTFENALKTGNLPKELRDSLVAWLTQMQAEGSREAADLLAALPADTTTTDNVNSAVQSIMDSAKEAFINAVDNYTPKAFKELRKELHKKIEAHKTDKEVLGQLLNQILDPTLRQALNQDWSTALRQQAYDETWGRVTAYIGGVQAAIDQNKPEQASAEFQSLVETLLILPDNFWSTMPDVDRTNLIAWITEQFGIDSLPDELKNRLGVAVQESVTSAFNSVVTPSTVTIGDVEVEGKRRAPGVPNLGKALVPPETQTEITTAITNAVSASVGAVVPIVPAMTAPVGNSVIVGIVNGIAAKALDAATAIGDVVSDMGSQARQTAAGNGGRSIGNSWGNAIVTALRNAKGDIQTVLAQVRAMLGGSLPTAGPLQHPDRGGASIATAWSKALDKGLGKTHKDVDKRLRALRKALHNAQGDVLKYQKQLRNADDQTERDYANYWLNEAKRRRNQAQDALNRYLGRHPGGDNTEGDTGKNRGDGNVRANIEKWRQKIREYRNEIKELLFGGLTEEEKRRKTYDEQLIEMYQSKIAAAHRRFNDGNKNNRRGRRRGEDTNPSDDVGAPEVTRETKRIIEIHIDVMSKDGSVDRVTQSAIRRAVMDSLALGDLEHLVTVG